MAAPNPAGAAPVVARFGGMNGRTDSATIPPSDVQNKLRPTSVSGATPLTTGNTAPSQPLPMSGESNTLTKGATSRKRQFDVLRDDVPAEIGEDVHKKRRLSPLPARRSTGNTSGVGHGTTCPNPIDAAGGAKTAVNTQAQDANAARTRLLADFKDAASSEGLADSETAVRILDKVLMSFDVFVKADPSSLSHGIPPTVVAGDDAIQGLPSSVTEPDNDDLDAQFCDLAPDGSPSSHTTQSGEEQKAADVPVDQDDTATVNNGLVGETGVTAAAPNGTTSVEGTDYTDKGPATTATTESDVTNKEPAGPNQAQLAPVPSQTTVELPSTISTCVPALRTADIAALASNVGTGIQEPVDEPSPYGLPRDVNTAFCCPEEILEQALLGAFAEFQDDDTDEDADGDTDEDTDEETEDESSPYGLPQNTNTEFYCPDDVLQAALHGASTEDDTDEDTDEDSEDEDSPYGPPQNPDTAFYCPVELLPQALHGALMDDEDDGQEPTGRPSFYGPPQNPHDSFYCPREFLPQAVQRAAPMPVANIRMPMGQPSFYGPPRNEYDTFYCPADVLGQVLQAQNPVFPPNSVLAPASLLGLNPMLPATSVLAPSYLLGLKPPVFNGAVQRPRLSPLSSLSREKSTTSATSSFGASMGSFYPETPVVGSSIPRCDLPHLASYGDPDLCIPLPHDVDPRYPAALRERISERRIDSRRRLEKIRLTTFRRGQRKGDSLEQMMEDHKWKGMHHVQRFRKLEQHIIDTYRQELFEKAKRAVQPAGVSPTVSTLGKRVRFSETDEVEFLEARPVKRSRTAEDVKPPRTLRPILKRPRQR